ncbi:MAG: 1,4-alpha-glucan branching protein GlgB [bacterium]
MTELIQDLDLHLWNKGTHYRIYDKLGAHPWEQDGAAGTHFAVWAPNAGCASVIGDWNNWTDGAHELRPVGDSGIWAAFVPGVGPGALYKYVLQSRDSGLRLEKADPFGFATELRPRTASKVWDLDGHRWQDEAWRTRRKAAQSLDAPISIYEVHLGSWMRNPDAPEQFLSYRELAPRLADYVAARGFTHVELLPVSEHPLDASWGYQTIGHFAPTSRHGTPDDFMHLVDTLHQAGVGVLLDWVPAHFPRDGHGLGFFDGTHLYEHADPRQGEHRDWGTYIFNFGRHEVSNFLIANALFWLDRYHIDGLRVDAVASMLYLDYSREEGDWIPNEHGGRENLAAIEFLRHLNSRVYEEFPDTMMMAEESTSWPQVSRPTYLGGLGFGYKWDMGWMHDTLRYFSHDPVHRKYHHSDLTFRMLYAWHENFVLPLSHDEVVHGKGSLLGQMPGDPWQRFANLRLLLSQMFVQPGKKLLFMGGEIGQWNEWRFDASLDWHLLDFPDHRGLQQWVTDLNWTYRSEPALHQRDTTAAGFEWIDCTDAENSVLSLLRHGDDGSCVVAVFNHTPVPRYGYRVGVPSGGAWRELLNSDAEAYGGSGVGNCGVVQADPIPTHGRPHSLLLTLPPLGALLFKPE